MEEFNRRSREMLNNYWSKILISSIKKKDASNIKNNKLKTPVKVKKTRRVEYKGISFTDREMDCLKLLPAKKNKAKEIALKLNLKQKTVEDYFRKIRVKTGYNKKMLIEFMKQGAITKRSTGSDCKSGG